MTTYLYHYYPEKNQLSPTYLFVDCMVLYATLPC